VEIIKEEEESGADLLSSGKNNEVLQKGEMTFQ
jgi:hypothetical protein